MTKEMLEKLSVIEWLLSPLNQGQGRSYLMAHAYVNVAIENSGMKIYIQDHHPTVQAKHALLEMIKRVIRERKLEVAFVFGKDWIECRFPRKRFGRRR